MDVPEGIIPCPIGVPAPLWRVLTTHYNQSQLCAIKYVSDLDNKEVSRARAEIPTTSTSTSTSSSGINNGEQSTAESSAKTLPHPVQPSGQRAGQDTRISLIQVE